MEEPDAHGLDGGSQLTGPLEPLPGHDELLLTEPLAPPSVPAPVPVKSRSVARKRSAKPTLPIADEDDDDSDEDDDDYRPPSPKVRRTEERIDSPEVVSSEVNSPRRPTTAADGDDPPVVGEIALPRPGVIVRRRKTMDDHVGPMYQADVPDGPLPPEQRSRRDDLAGELVWEPSIVPDEHLSRFLMALDGAEECFSAEKALKLLRQRHYDYKSLTLDVLYGPPGLDLQRRRRKDILNKEEQRMFKEALTVLGKDFHLIARCMHRSVHELIDYYYLWKKQRKFHASVAHIPYTFYIDPTIRLPRLVDTEGPMSGPEESSSSSSSSDEEDSDESANCQQS